MSLTIREKKSKVLFDTDELFIIKEALEYTHPFYDESFKRDIYEQHGIVIGEKHDEVVNDLKEKMRRIFEASRVHDFEGYEYR